MAQDLSNSCSCPSIFETVRERFESLGFSLGLVGASAGPHGARSNEDTLASVLLDHSSHFREALRPLLQRQDLHGVPHELCPGLWLIITPRTVRRRVCGYIVALHGSTRLTTDPASLQAIESWGCELGAVRALTESHTEPSPDSLQATAASMGWACDDLNRIEAGAGEIRSLGAQLTDVYEELSLLHKVGENMNVAAQPERFIRLICRELLGVLPYRWVAVRLLDGETSSHQLAGMFIAEGNIGGRNAEISKLITKYLLSTEMNAPKIIPDSSRDESPIVRELGRTLLVYPLMRGARVIGAVVAADKRGPDEQVSSVDVKLIATTASQLQIFLDNVGLYEDVQLMFLGTLEALTAAIDAKDPYTCGHSERVALLSRDLARAIGLSEPEVERVHISGIVHDVGKIGVPESVLCKPGRLTSAEFELIKQHPQIGGRILRDIPHFHDILPGVLYHHERFDGRGYPEGRAGYDIPLYGRIIAIADSFDAMSSTRTYRAARSRDAALEEIHRCAGTQFDPEFARIFVQLDFREYDALARSHRDRYADQSEAAA